MRFHEFGDRNAPLVILLHGMLTPWQMWEPQIKQLQQCYFVLVPALNAHVEEETSEYLSAEDEAEIISQYLLRNYGPDVFMLCGLSMGGVVANKLYESGTLRIKHIIFDGAPLVPPTPFRAANRAIEAIMRKQYTSIIHGAQRRDPKVLRNFSKYFLPEKYLESFLRFADTMSDRSIANIVHSACSNRMSPPSNCDVPAILFLHGTKANELISRQAAKKVCQLYKSAVVKCFNGYAHGELAIYKPDEWLTTISAFLDGASQASSLLI